MPHATLYLVPAVSYPAQIVETWVNYAKPEDREMGSLYEVIYMRDMANESSRDEVLYAGDDEALAKQAARGAEIAKTIIADILARPVRATASGEKANLLMCNSFSELHDCCDANLLGDSEKLLDECGHTWGKDEAKDDEARGRAVDILNIAQAIVDLWLKNIHPLTAASAEEKNA
jgi:hypothetical protein